ncbi:MULTISPECIES: hypothetical protein [unclassified Pseudoclavibacter]|uniref:hypothetical protein n=1 Tax=unclassified Pseudoclavibacter TaxID=2615177 RepID=UPI001BA5A4D4|nr:hypothetical protein [Pseudoclavibacter sp. Marseille-Q4354]MBS3177744.1 hypothetical protein [Pseudoclavibacter sp. Marseille-Q4354]
MFASVTTPGSDEWVATRLATKLGADYPRLALLAEHQAGTVSVPDGGNGSMRDSYARFLNLARLNLAQLLVAAVTDRWRPVGFTSATATGLASDREAAHLYRRIHGKAVSRDVLHDVAVYGRGIALAGRFAGRATARRLSPWRALVDAPDGEPWNATSAIAISWLPEEGADQLTLWRVVDGRVYSRRARRASKVSTIPDEGTRLASWYPGMGWGWIEEAQLIPWAAGRLPVVPVGSEDGKGQFEPHLDSLDRINHQIFQRITITVMQAFRQRAIKGLPKFYPEGHPQAGQEIDYGSVFEAGPAALWQLPLGAEIWESAVTDIGPLRLAIADDVKHLSAVSRTPSYMLGSDGANNSAESASLAREGLVFKVEDLQARADEPLGLLMEMCFAADGQPRTDGIAIVWAPADRSSIAERSQAASQASTTLPRRSIWRLVFRFTPEEIEQIEQDERDERLLDPEPAAA